MKGKDKSQPKRNNKKGGYRAWLKTRHRVRKGLRR